MANASSTGRSSISSAGIAIRSIRAERVFITCADKPIEPPVSPTPARIFWFVAHKSVALSVEMKGAFSIENLPRAFLSTFFASGSAPAAGAGQPSSAT